MPDSLAIDVVVNTDAAQSSLEQTASGFNDVASAADRGNEAVEGYESSVNDADTAQQETEGSSQGLGLAIGGLGSKVLVAATAFLAANVGLNLLTKGASTTFELFDRQIGIIDRARTSFILAGDSISFAQSRATNLVNTLRFDTLETLSSVSNEVSFLFQHALTQPERTAVEELALQLDRAGVSSRDAALEFATLLQASTPTEQLFNDIALQLGILPERLRELTQDGIGPFITYLQDVNDTQSDYKQALFDLEDAFDDLKGTLAGFGDSVFTPFISGFANIVDNLVTTEEEADEAGGAMQNIFGWNYSIGQRWKSSVEEVDSDLETLLATATTVQDKLDIVFGRKPRSTGPFIGPRQARPSPDAPDDLSLEPGLFAFPLADPNNRLDVPRFYPDDIVAPEIGFDVRPEDLPAGSQPTSQNGVSTPVNIMVDDEVLARIVIKTMDGVVRQVPAIL